MIGPFAPQVLSEEEIVSLLSQVSDEEIAQAHQFSLTPLFTTRLVERNRVFCRLNQANRCFLSILERQKCSIKRKTRFLISDAG